MRQGSREHLQEISEELLRLKQEAQYRPAPWTCQRIAELEGILASYREEFARAETQRIFQKLKAKQ